MNAPRRGARVVRTVGGRDWPGVVRGVPFPAVDGDRVRVLFDAGSAVDVLVCELRPEAEAVDTPTQPAPFAEPGNRLR